MSDYQPAPIVHASWRDSVPKDCPQCKCGQPLWAESSLMLGLCANCCAPEHRVLIYDGPPWLSSVDDECRWCGEQHPHGPERCTVTTRISTVPDERLDG